MNILTRRGATRFYFHKGEAREATTYDFQIYFRKLLFVTNNSGQYLYALGYPSDAVKAQKGIDILFSICFNRK